MVFASDCIPEYPSNNTLGMDVASSCLKISAPCRFPLYKRRHVAAKMINLLGIADGHQLGITYVLRVRSGLGGDLARVNNEKREPNSLDVLRHHSVNKKNNTNYFIGLLFYLHL